MLVPGHIRGCVLGVQVVKDLVQPSWDEYLLGTNNTSATESAKTTIYIPSGAMCLDV